ncbi:TonB-dependent receptor plug domain-containing protein, partial [Siphonobacter sp. BAB-5405]|uniref:TonB-dependent receptor plug domain-containing protein n=1 Tax=Siphonobacter sp. BAB-5405 TaxID=1864825 RepID=UPI001304E72A
MVNNRTTIDIELKEDPKNLQEVVVNVGYSTMRKSDLTGSVSSVKADAFENSVPTTLDQALQGRVAGMSITQNSGVPGGGSSIQIRGVNSINSSNEPIYVVDGVIINGRTGDNDRNAIASINPNDIESIEVLKDASAAAIYGAQGANGVILITMKKGKVGKPVINFNTKVGLQELPRRVDVMNLREYAQHHNDYSDVLGYGRRLDFSRPEALGEGTDWQKTMFRVAPMQTYDLSLRGGMQNSNYSLSVGHLNQNGIIYGSGYKRTTVRLSVDNSIGSQLRMGATINVSQDKQNTAVSSWSVLGNALFQTPAIPVYNADGTFGGPTSEFDANNLGFSNPLAIATLNTRDRENVIARGNIY